MLDLNLNPYATFLIVASLVPGVIALYAWRRRTTPGALMFAVLMLALAIWTLAYGLELACTTLACMLFWIKIEYLGICSLPLVWLVFILQYTRRDSWLTRRNLVLLSLIPVLTLVLNWTNEFHHLYYSSTAADTSYSFPLLAITPGPWYRVNFAFFYLCLLVGILVLWQSFRSAAPLYRRQTGLMLIGALAPWLVNVLYLSGIRPFAHLDLTPFAFVITGLAISSGMFRLRLLDIVPVARDKVVEWMGSGVLVLDTQHRVVDLNPAAYQFIKTPSGSPVGRQAEEVLTHWSEIAAQATGTTETFLEFILNLEPPRHFDLHIIPLLERNGTLTGRLLIWHDITPRKQVEMALEQAKDAAEQAQHTAEAANQAKSIFLANMSHELRTPLNSILGYTQILKRTPNLTPYQKDGLATIEESGRHLLSLINDILDTSKIEAGKLELYPKDIDFARFMAQVVGTVQGRARQKELLFAYEAGDNLPAIIHADETRLRQVLLNLLGNAVKFTETGQVTLRVGVRDQGSGAGEQGSNALSSHPQSLTPNPQPPIPNSRPLIHLRFEVEDTGPGVPADQIDQLFEPFEQVGDLRQQAEGTGLGLTISRQLVQLMGGQIQVNSQPGQGSKFWFEIELPAEDNRPIQTRRPARQIIGYQGPARTVLVVDDILHNRLVLVNKLALAGLQTLEASNGAAGLVQAVTHRPDVIITELMIPEMGGVEFIRLLRQQPELKQTLIIASSSRVFEQDRQACLNAGAADFLPKPIQADQLFEILQARLRLTWIYDDTKPDAGLSEPPPVELSVPPPDRLSVLLKLAITGNMQNLAQEAIRLAEADRQFAPFASQLIQLAETFQVDQIEEFLKKYLDIEEETY